MTPPSVVWNPARSKPMATKLIINAYLAVPMASMPTITLNCACSSVLKSHPTMPMTPPTNASKFAPLSPTISAKNSMMGIESVCLSAR